MTARVTLEGDQLIATRYHDREYERPVWPSRADEQITTMHLDIGVTTWVPRWRGPLKLARRWRSISRNSMFG